MKSTLLTVQHAKGTVVFSFFLNIIVCSSSGTNFDINSHSLLRLLRDTMTSQNNTYTETE